MFALADTAFAIACNEDERVTVAQGADIDVPEVDHRRSDAHGDGGAPRHEAVGRVSTT